MLTKRGFTLIELLIALVLMGIVSSGIYAVMINNQRVYRQQTLRIELNDNLRSAVAILPADLRELNSMDLISNTASDIQEMTASSIVYKAMRSLYTICLPAPAAPGTPPNPVSGGTLTLDATMIGLRGLSRDFDSLLVFADVNPDLMTDDVWLHVDVTDVQPGNNCPGNQPSLAVQVNPPIALASGVFSGAPVRGFEMSDVRSYTDASGMLWLGARRYSKSVLWSNIQPIAGPLQPGGFQLAYFDVNGFATANPRLVARIDITVIGRTSQPVSLADGSLAYVADTLMTQVALRNR